MAGACTIAKVKVALAAAFLLASLALSVAAAQRADLSAPRFWFGEIHRVEGDVADLRADGRWHYTFFSQWGTRHSDASYAPEGVTPGAQFEIEYPASDPGLSRIVGMRRGAGPFWMAGVFVLPVVAAFFLVQALFRAGAVGGRKS